MAAPFCAHRTPPSGTDVDGPRGVVGRKMAKARRATRRARAGAHAVLLGEVAELRAVVWGDRLHGLKCEVDGVPAGCRPSALSAQDGL